jgi:hypothetical protein
MSAYAPIAAMAVFPASRLLFEQIVTELGGQAAGCRSHDQLENYLAEAGRELQRLLLQEHLDLRAGREERRASACGPDGIERRHLEAGHQRLLATRFGKVTVTRIAYRSPALGVGNVYPADELLDLPAEQHSHTLRRMAAVEVVRGSYATAHTAISAVCGPVAGTKQLALLIERAAVDIDAFYTSRARQPWSDTTVLVLTADAKGAPMRPQALREATRKAAGASTGTGTGLSSGNRAHRKRMATIAGVYDTEPVPRRPDDIITTSRAMPTTGTTGCGQGEGQASTPKTAGPRAINKWLTGSFTHSAEHVIETMFNQAEQRDPTHRRPWVALVDGARHQLDLIEDQARRRGIDLHIIVDFIHVASYVWGAARDLHPHGDPAADLWVARQLSALLHGRAEEVIEELDSQATAAALSPDRRQGIDACLGYLRAKKPFLAYDRALAQGWPIATGVIEGAVRHLIGDRLDIAGAHWGLAGAEAVLMLRALIANGDLDDYWPYHLAQEHQRVYHACDQAEYDLTA